MLAGIRNRRLRRSVPRTVRPSQQRTSSRLPVPPIADIDVMVSLVCVLDPLSPIINLSLASSAQTRYPIVYYRPTTDLPAPFDIRLYKVGKEAVVCPLAHHSALDKAEFVLRRPRPLFGAHGSNRATQLHCGLCPASVLVVDPRHFRSDMISDPRGGFVLRGNGWSHLRFGPNEAQITGNWSGHRCILPLQGLCCIQRCTASPTFRMFVAKEGGAEFIVVGTSHNRCRAAEEVKAVIEEERPDVVLRCSGARPRASCSAYQGICADNNISRPTT